MEMDKADLWQQAKAQITKYAAFVWPLNGKSTTEQNSSNPLTLFLQMSQLYKDNFFTPTHLFKRRLLL